MKRRADSTSVLARPAGRRLRCFLGKAWMVLALCFAVCGMLSAQVEPPGTLHLWHLHGYFVNATGTPLANVEVTLQRDGQVFYKTKTDGSGRFAFEHVSGPYVLHIDKAKYSELSRQVIVGVEAATMLRGETVYVIAGPGACTDDCSSVFTSKIEFEKAISRDKNHQY